MKSNPSNRFVATFIFIFFSISLSFTGFVRASHNSGADISYTHVSGNLYKMHANYYRDCFGIPAPVTLLLHVESVSCNISLSFTMNQIPGSGVLFIQVCPGTLTTCDGGSVFGIQKWEYEVDVNLPGQCADWIFYFSDCCRNAGNTTIQNPGGESVYVEARLNNLNGDNNSPQFTNVPFVFACLNQDLNYNNGMFDPDGDSLVYQLVCARTAPNTCVNYFPPHSAQQPFISTPPITFDYFTGDLFIHPTAVEVGPIVYEILDYRNGELMGSVLRDITVYIQSCTNQNPEATHMNGTTQQFAWLFPNDTICFDILSDDVNASDNLTMTWNQVIPGATFVTAGSPHPTGLFCWTPTINDVRSQPYMFTATIQDDNCPINNYEVYSYYIYVTLDSSLVFLNAGGHDVVHSFYCYTNPSNGIFTFKSGLQFSMMKVYNSIGDCVMNKDFASSIELTGRAPGIYFVELIAADGKRAIQKLVVE